MRAFGGRTMIFGLQHITIRTYVFNDAVLFFLPVVWAFNTPKKHRAGKDGGHAGHLRIGHAEYPRRVNANHFDQEASDSSQDQIVAENFAFGFRPLYRFRTHMPKKRANRAPDNQFVERRWMHA